MNYNSHLSDPHRHLGSFAVACGISSDPTTFSSQYRLTFRFALPLQQLHPRWDLILRSALDIRPYFVRDDVSYSVPWQEYRGVLKWVAWCQGKEDDKLLDEDYRPKRSQQSETVSGQEGVFQHFELLSWVLNLSVGAQRYKYVLGWVVRLVQEGTGIFGQLRFEEYQPYRILTPKKDRAQSVILSLVIVSQERDCVVGRKWTYNVACVNSISWLRRQATIQYLPKHFTSRSIFYQLME